jgi:hypothetical protein
VIKGREILAVELQWHRLREMEMGKVRRWGATIFRGEEGEEARQLHSAKGG